MTLTEKLMARASGKKSVQPGDNVWVNVDVLMTHDVCGPGTIGVFKREFGKDARVWDREKIVIIPDHYIFTADSKSNRNVDILRDFVREQKLKYFYDVIDDPNGHWAFDASKGQLQRQYGGSFAGVCHTALPAKGHTRPGEILLGTDSHTCMAGAFGEFATGIGNTDAGFVFGTGKLLLKVPETMRFWLEGRLQRGVMAKDVILHCIGDIGFDGATYRAMQFQGPGAKALSMDDRMTIANMAIEAGGKNGIFEPDDKTFAYVDERTKANGTKSSYNPLYSRLYRVVHGRQDQRLPRVRRTDPGPQGQDRHVRRAGDAGCRSRIAGGEDGWQNRLAGARRRGRADDRKRQLRGLPRRADRHVRTSQQTDEMHQRDEPQFPRSHGSYRVPGVPWVAVHGRRQRHHRKDHGSEGVPQCVRLLGQISTQAPRASNRTVAAGFSLRGKGAPMKGAATGE